MREIYELYKEVKKPLQSHSSLRSLKKSLSKECLKRQGSSPYLQSESSHQHSKSPKRKNKSIDLMKLRKANLSQVATRSKFGGHFESLKKPSG